MTRSSISYAGPILAHTEESLPWKHILSGEEVYLGVYGRWESYVKATGKDIFHLRTSWGYATSTFHRELTLEALRVLLPVICRGDYIPPGQPAHIYTKYDAMGESYQ